MINKSCILPVDELPGELYGRIYLLIRKNRWSQPSFGAIFGLVGGMLSIILGLLLWAEAGVLPSGRFGAFLFMLSNLFFALPLPLLALGAHCLDLLEKMPPVLPLKTGFKPVCSERWQRLHAQRPHHN